MRLRAGAVFVMFACTSHERSQEPAAPCPTGMVLIGGDEGPQAVARVCMDVTEVTTAGYSACVQAGVCTPAIVGIGEGCNLADESRGAHPINCASWDQAQTYCGWLGKRLPDDEEWIWAAHGGAAATPFPWGRAPPDPSRACWARKDQGTCLAGGIPGAVSPAGIFDLVGNVAEWTRGYSGRAQQGASVGLRGRLRGGSFMDEVYAQPIDERWADSAFDEPAEAASLASGLRCVVAPDTPVQVVDESAWVAYRPTPGGLPPVLAAAAVAVAPTRPLANLAVIDRDDEPQAVWWSVGEQVLPMATSVAIGLKLQEHLTMGARPMALRDFEPMRWIGDAVLFGNGSSYDPKFAAIEPETFKLRWQLALGNAGRSYLRVVTPRSLVLVYSTFGSDALIGYALDSGRELWRVRGGEGSAKFRLVKELQSDDERVFVVGDTGLIAYDANTGKQLWGPVAVGTGCGVTVGSGAVIVEQPDALVRLDAGSGDRGTVIPRAGRCGWGRDAWRGEVHPGVIAGGRLLAFMPHVDEQPEAFEATLHAYDLATGGELWRRTKLDGGRLVADQDAVYVARGETLLALDASDGVTRAEVSIGSEFGIGVEQAGGEAGPLVVVDGDAGVRWVLGRRPEPTPLESYVIRGRVVPNDAFSRRHVAGVPVKIGERVVRTDAQGRFEVRGKAVGALSVSIGTDRGPGERGGSKVRFEPTTVVLDGSGKYVLDDLELTQWYLA